MDDRFDKHMSLKRFNGGERVWNKPGYERSEELNDMYRESRSPETSELMNIIRKMSQKLDKQSKDNERLANTIRGILKDSPKAMNTFKEVSDALDVNNANSLIISLLKDKVSTQDGKGLSTHDLDDELYNKLLNNYTKDELDEMLRNLARQLQEAISASSANNYIPLVEEGEEETDQMVNGLGEGNWYGVIVPDEDE